MERCYTVEDFNEGYRIQKIGGCSLIEVNDSVVEFYSLDERSRSMES